MKIIRRILILVALVLMVNNVSAQPPKPPTGPTSDARNQTSINRTSTPIGTATGLLIVLGTGFAVYKLRKNTKEDEDKNQRQ